MIKFFCLFLLFSIIPCFTLYAEEAKTHLSKKNKFSLSAGWRLQHEMEFLDYWAIKKSTFNGFVPEISFDRIFLKYLDLSLSLGYFGLNGNLNSTDDRVHIDNYNASASLKIYMPVMDSLLFYAGAGGDYYYTKSYYRMFDSSANVNRTDSAFHFVGYHALGGIEYYFYKHPEEYGFYDMPVSIFIAYKMSVGSIKDFDKKSVELKNAINNTSDISHDFIIDSQSVFMGLRWSY